MEWIYQNNPLTEIPEDAIGFVYLITNLTNGKCYIGKKLFRFTRTRKVKGKRQKKVVSSDWLSYYGSSKVLKEDVLSLGETNFKREILHLCKTKGECSYMEAYEIFTHNAILSENFYNESIMCRIHRKHLPK